MSSTKKVAVITGGLGQLGQAVASRLLGDGWRVALIDQAIGASALEGGDVLILTAIDVSTLASAKAAFDKIVEAFGRIDALVNVAGTFRWETMDAGDIETFDLLYTVNLRTAVVASKAALPHLLKQPSSIVNIGAASAMAKAASGISAYAASKAGVAKLTESMADEFKDQNLRVNAVLPSIIDTPANRRDMPDADFSRWVSPAALADVVAFLLSAAASAVTGALVPVTGRV